MIFRAGNIFVTILEGEKKDKSGKENTYTTLIFLICFSGTAETSILEENGVEIN
jgi:hypothetical protein